MKSLTPLDFYFAGPDVESPHRYQPGGYHPVHIGDVYRERYRVIHKLGFGTYSTVWLAHDLHSTTPHHSGPRPLTTPPPCSRYVALKFIVAELTGRNNEIKIHHRLALQSGTHPGSDRVLALLDHFKVQGPNGEHDVLVSQVVGPHLGAIFDSEPSVIHQAIKPLAHQITLGISFLHHRGVVHADLHQGNIVFEIASLDGESEENAMLTLGMPEFLPVLTRDRLHQTDSLPKYLVYPGSLAGRVKHDDVRIKIIDLGGAFFSTEVPQCLHTPLQVRAPEVIVNHLSTLLKVEVGMRIDVWSIGCLVYELATSRPLIGRYSRDEAAALRELATVLGPLPEEWTNSIGASYVTSTCDTLERRIRSITGLNDTPGLITLLQQILVFDPLQRPGASDLLKHPWFSGSSGLQLKIQLFVRTA